MSFQWGQPQRVRHRVFVSYQHTRDQAYYDHFSRHFHDTYEAVYDNSLERRIDSDDTSYVIRRIREGFIAGTSCTIVLVGAETWGRKYIDWEIKATLEMEHGLIGVYLPSAPRAPDGTITVPDRLHDNVVSGYAPFVSWGELTASSLQLSALIADAKNRPANRIRNDPDRRLRNA